MKLKPIHIFLLVFVAAALLAMQQVTPGYGGSSGTTYYEDPVLARSRIMAEANEQIMATIRETYEYRQRTMDRINRNWDNYIRGTGNERSHKCR